MSLDDEWSVLESIHPTICISYDDGIATLLVPVELGKDTPVFIFSVPHDTYLSSNQFIVPPDVPALHTSLSILPPLRLRIALPPLYPSQAPPIIQSLQANSAWLPPCILTLVEERLIAMWSPGDDSGILYTWVEWIRTGNFLSDIGFLADDLLSIQIPHPSPQILLTPLLAYLSAFKSDEFAHASYLCAICLSERKGVYCLALSCGHVFCKSCLIDMWGLHVKEGQVSHVGCPEPNCGKTDTENTDGLREATEDEVSAVLSETELSRWNWLRKKRDLERDPTMIHCPMEYCQEPVTKPQPDTSKTNVSDEDESGWARLRTCTACSYSFCAFCRRTWYALSVRHAPPLLIVVFRHGPHTSCPLPLTSKFILDYLSAPPNSSERLTINQRYGRANILRLVKQHEEEQENRKWMQSSTMACPGCEVRVEKSIGCNHVRAVLFHWQRNTIFALGNHFQGTNNRTDDLCQMWNSLLLPLWYKDHRTESISAFLYASHPLFFQIV
ncbi:RWD-domain-containing protein [Chiua virens]|nr:RWD-domain-containing protein [Chiua virens]